MARAPTTIRLVDTPPDNPFEPVEVTIEVNDELTPWRDDDGVLHIPHEDGSVTLDTNPPPETAGTAGFYDNLCSEVEESRLSQIATDLLAGIEVDDLSRKEWLSTRERGITLLGLKLEEPRGDVGTSSAPLEGMSTIRHPLLLEAVVRFQATARSELLPSTGPVKVRNDQPPPPPAPQAPPVSGAPLPSAPAPNQVDELAEALEKDMNHYLTVTATEYVPDTDRMLFYIGFGGQGFKKVYNCPLRRRPVSESVDAEDVIVSNAATNMRNCGRVTHRIKMRPSVVRRMQILGAYRDVELQKPSIAQENVVDQKKAETTGIQPPKRPEDQDYTLYECYCELDLDQFAPKKFKGKGLPLPYRVTIEKDSRQVLDIRRNWDEDDPEALPKQFFVEFPFIRGLGFYGLGYLHLLGNLTICLTALWREMVDAGMFANFPGFLFVKGIGRQLTNQFRIPPGGGQAVETGGMKIGDAVMPLPYKEPGAAFVNFSQQVDAVGQRLGQTATISVGEGKQDAPVGTTLALIEQATKMLDSVHKRLHASQAEEFGLLKERFREDPEAFWRHNKRSMRPWTKDQFLQALDQWELVPVADPNNPTSLHRIAKIVAVQQMAAAKPTLYDPKAVDMLSYRMMGFDPSGIFLPTPASPPEDPRMHAIAAKAAAEQMDAQIRWAELQLKKQEADRKAALDQEDQQMKAKEMALRSYLEQLNLQKEWIIHGHELARDNASTRAEIHGDQLRNLAEIGMEHQRHRQDLAHDAQAHVLDLHKQATGAATQTHVAATQHAAQMERGQQLHEQRLQHGQQTHEARLEQIRAQARAKPKGEGNGS